MTVTVKVFVGVTAIGTGISTANVWEIGVRRLPRMTSTILKCY